MMNALHFSLIHEMEGSKMIGEERKKGIPFTPVGQGKKAHS
jgi:quinol-cytochrome oxidoreductase complex cytochrome b subunit